MKKILIIALFSLFSISAFSQIIVDSALVSFLTKYPNVEMVPVSKDTSYWRSYSKVEVLFSESYYKYWAAGGNNMVMGLLKFDWNAQYEKGKFKFSNILKMEYGQNWQQNSFWRKSNDLIDYTGNAGYLVMDKWYASTQLRFTTQFANGYDYKSDGNHVLKSSFLSPGRIFIGVGAKYNRNDDFYMYISPFTQNVTLVVNDSLAIKADINKNGKTVYTKIGPWVDVYWRYNFYKDYVVTNKMSLYSDYVYHFGSIDFFDWQFDLSIPLHKYFTVSLGFHTRYEKDVLFDVEGSTTGEKVARLQFKQLLGIGFKYEI